MAITLSTIYRYPVKGLSAERLARVTLAPGECLPGDRRFALARASSSFDPDRPQWLPKTHFLMLMREEKLARLRTRFDEATGVLTIAEDGRELLRAPITEAQGRARVDAFFAAFLEGDITGPPRLVEAPGVAFANAGRRPHALTGQYVSLMTLATIRALADEVGVPLDPLRFRANFYLDGAAPWTEFDWVGAEPRLGSARLRVVSPTPRCTATHVNPATAVRDLDIVGTLRRRFGHIDMGVYAEVLDGGDVVEGDELRLIPSPLAGSVR